VESEAVIRVDEVLSDYDKLFLDKNYEKLLLNGNILEKNAFVNEIGAKALFDTDGKMYRIYDSTGKFVAVYKYSKKTDILKPEKMFM
jgi:tRNA pseudouridine55 synthase